MTYRKLTVGADPEVFLYKPGSVDITAACGLIGGTKQQGIPIGPPHLGISVHEDGAALEFNFAPIEHVPFSKKFENVFAEVLETVNEYIKTKGFVFSEKTFHDFSSAVLAKHKKQLEFGCDPDFDAYTYGAPLPRLNAAEWGGRRCVGGHLHFGWDKSLCPIPDYAMVQYVEALALLPTLRSNRKFVGPERARMYGRPGAFRPKPYGVEYRTPSNYWAVMSGYSFVENASNVLWWVINNVHESRALYDSINFSEVKQAVETLAPSRELIDKMVALRDEFVDKPLAALFKKTKKTKVVAAEQNEEAPVFNPFDTPLFIGGAAPQREQTAEERAVWDRIFARAEQLVRQDVVPQAVPQRAQR
jgi:hypothetical protein